jgi:hypothetical protein
LKRERWNCGCDDDDDDDGDKRESGKMQKGKKDRNLMILLKIPFERKSQWNENSHSRKGDI